MQPPRDVTLRTLLGDLYPPDSSGDGQELSSQLLQILSESSGDGDMAEHIDRWDGGDVVLITYADTIGEEGVPCLLYTSPSPRDLSTSRMPSSA